MEYIRLRRVDLDQNRGFPSQIVGSKHKVGTSQKTCERTRRGFQELDRYMTSSPKE